MIKKYYYEEDNFKLIQGDSLKVLRNIEPNSVDMVFADPPYFLQIMEYHVVMERWYRLIKAYGTKQLI